MARTLKTKRVLSDAAFFNKFPFRRFRARRVLDKDVVGPVTIFVRDIDGRSVEADTVVVGHVRSKSMWLFFRCCDITHLSSDAAITGFLTAYNVDPTTMRQA